MRYSLLSRFQGALCGSLIGSALAKSPTKLILTEEVLSPWQKMSLRLIEKLIEGEPLAKIEEETEKLLISSSAIALITLPLAVYYHDYPSQWRKEVEKLTIRETDLKQGNEDVLIWEYAIALALREKLAPNRFIAQLREQFPRREIPLRNQLEQIEIFLTAGMPLNQVVSQLSRPLTTSQSQKESSPNSTAMALALYCFAATPEDFRLSLLRARQTGYQISLTTALTGALAGAYNSFSGIPLAWRWLTRSQPLGKSLYQQVSPLFARWAGVYTDEELDILLLSAVASPLVIQPRSSLKIISQKEYL